MDKWISCSERLPEKSGWYAIKTDLGEFEAPYSLTFMGKFIWVVPNPENITHWKNKDVHTQVETNNWDEPMDN